MNSSIAPNFAIPTAIGLLLLPVCSPSQESGGDGEASRVIVPSSNRGVRKDYVGDWGHLIFQEILIEAPKWYLTSNRGLRNWRQGTVWRFPGDVAKFRQVLTDAGVPPLQVSALTSPEVLRVADSYLEIRPTESSILSLSKANRTRIYPRLGLGDINDFFQVPIQLAPGGIDRIRESAADLPQNLLELTTKLTYPGPTGILYFSDLHYVLGKAENDAQRLRLAQLLSREPSGSAVLKVSEHAEENSATLDYWVAGGKNPDAAVALSAALENPEVKTFEVIHLLPPGPRKLLNTYPSREESIGSRHPDCFATGFTFFQDEIPPRFFDPLDPDLMKDYVPAHQPWQLGDLIVILNPDGVWLHICNYVAGEIVFTKNGKSPERPWVLQSMDDVFASYLREKSATVAFFRLKHNSAH